MSIEIKICGLTRRCDVELAAQLGADYLGFVCVATSKRFVPNHALKSLTSDITTPKVGVFVDATLEYIEEAIELGNLDIVQLHGHETPEFAQKISGVKVWKAFHLPAQGVEDFPAERLLIDGSTPGSGELCNWQNAAEIAKLRPIMLAGGISAENMAQAIKIVNPKGIDLASSVESAPGIKDRKKLEDILKGIRK